MYKNTILPASLLAGTIIGAGIFALPFVFMNAGIIAGLFYLIIFCLVFILIHLMYAEVIIKTNGEHRFPGYAKIYLGKFGFFLATLTDILGMLLVLTVFLILSASFLNLILPSGFAVSEILKVLLFWFLGSAAIFLEIRSMAFSEFLILIGIILIALMIFIFGAFNFAKIASFPLLNFKNIFLPYGIILFALAGRVAIPAVINYFQKINPETRLPAVRQGQTQKIKQSIILGTLIPAIVYFLFVFGVLGLSGNVSEDAVSGLIGSVSPLVLFLVGIFGLISIWSSYIVVGLDVKSAFRFDLKIPKILAGLIVISAPLILFLTGFQNFLTLVSFIGGIFIALEGIFIALMWLKARRVKTEEIIFKKLSPVIAYILIIVFIGGMIYKLIY